MANWIYIGPSIAPIGLKQNTLYLSDEMPEALQKIASNKPVVKALFLEVSDLAEAKKRLNKKGSLEHTATQEMLAIAKTIPH